ncbi:MAG: aspartate aminotransferase family protein [Flavobacteriales bacterium]|nr:aspartate aminotransferase family protein [Flavobacteriales bacterium]
MEKKWKKLAPQQIRDRVFAALEENVNYYEEDILGVPASHLDSKVFYQQHPFLKDAPFISTLLRNPNHIGCHTLDRSESFFKGTQKLEREVIEICARDILKGDGDLFDGYVASGGTEANIQAIWIYRNYFMQEFNADLTEICILCSADTHYSIDKAANLLQIPLRKVQVGKDRTVHTDDLHIALNEFDGSGIKYLIVIANMMTTMFGSVDPCDRYTDTIREHGGFQFKMHVDGAYGGFFFPFSCESSRLNFTNPDVDSVTLDAHKMAQAPYGTGIFICRKGLINYTNTKEASYVEGEDFTLIGSRSGANAIAIWMILMTHGPYGWREKVAILKQRCDWLCAQLAELGIGYYRNEHSNIVTLDATKVPSRLAADYGLVPDDHVSPSWYKIVIMEHVSMERMEPLIEELNALNDSVNA